LQNFVFLKGELSPLGGRGVKICSTMTPKKEKKKKKKRKEKKTTVRVADDFFEKDAKVT
jgi:hypothetical protein